MKEASPVTHQDSYVSFLVRFWLIRSTNGEDGPACELQSVQSGETWRFENLEAMFAFLRDYVSDMLAS